MSRQNDAQPLRVYCAGPLFNRYERQEMTAIADALCGAGYTVYLPHRDGMEFRLILNELLNRGWSATVAAQFLHEAIFVLDVYQLVVECDAMIWNLNGRTPDEGAVSEAAINWTLGKPLVAYSDDVRSLIAGRVNPLLVGLVEFQTVDQIDQIPKKLSQAIVTQDHSPLGINELPPTVQRAVSQGRQLWEVLCEEEAAQDNDIIADIVEQLFAPQGQKLNVES